MENITFTDGQRVTQIFSNSLEPSQIVSEVHWIHQALKKTYYDEMYLLYANRLNNYI